MARERKVLAAGLLMVVLGTILLALAFCETRHIRAAQIRSIVMGYSTGKEVFEGACSSKASFTECVACCNFYGAGLPPQERDACIDLCIDKWETQNGPGSVGRDMLAAAEKLLDKNHAGLVSAKVMLARTCSSVKYPRYARMARLFCKEVGV